MNTSQGIAVIVAGLTFFTFPLAGDDGRPSPAESTRPEPTPELLAEGKSLYEENCASCHGDTGEGDGEAAYLLLPAPRDFTEAKFNRRNTPPKNLPADDDLFIAISDGLLGSAMPPWKDYLTEVERWALVEYLKQELIALYDEDAEEMLSLYELDPPGTPLTVPEAVPPTAENLAIGKAVYQSVSECWTCHGRQGHGDGPDATDIVNARGERIYPPDLTKGIYKLSSDNRELFRRIRDGITLAPMYSMSETLTDDEVWCLVHYVRSLVNRSEEERTMHEQFRREIKVSRIRGALPRSADAEAWTGIPSQYIPLIPLWWRRDRIEGIFVKAVHNRKDIAIQLSWIDDTEDTSVMRTQDFYDGAAIQFSADEHPPFFGMGAKDATVNIWHWKADWEVEQSIDQTYQNMASDHYQYRKGSVAGEHGKVVNAALSDYDPMFLTGLGAGNPLSNFEPKTSVEDLNAGGFGTLTSQGRKEQGVQGTSQWYKGLWRVSFTRALAAKGDGDIALSAGDSVNVGFAVWNGAQMDRNGQKSVTIWHRLQLED